MNQSELELLADRIIATTDKPDRAKTHVYYLMRIEHPAMIALYNRFKVSLNIPTQFPPSDRERTMFELSLLNKAAIRELAAFCDWYERHKPKKGKEKALCPPHHR